MLECVEVTSGLVSFVSVVQEFGDYYEPDFWMTLLRYQFAAFLVAGYVILRSGSWQGRWPTGLGILLFGVPGLLRLVEFDRAMGRRDFEEFATFLYIVAIALLLIGAFLIRGARSAGALASTGPTTKSLESLRVPRTGSTALSRAEDLRNKLLDRFREVCRAKDVQVVWYRSAPFESPVWFTAELDLREPSNELSLRAALKVTIDPLEFHRFEHPMTITATRGTTKKVLHGALDLPESTMRDICAWGTGYSPGVKLRAPRLRQLPWQLWRPRNRITRLRVDWFSVFLALVTVAMLAIPIIGLLCAAGSALVLWLFNRHRLTWVLTSGKPSRDPRALLLMDSWQTNVDGLGSSVESVRADVVAALRASSSPGVVVDTEAIAYPGVDGKVERNQIVLTYRRAIAFLHLEPYGSDLYVGWDSHSNAGTWMEKTVGRGVDRVSGKLVVANKVITATQRLNEYDLTDVNFLTEWLHRSVTRVVRTRLAEAKIDQEIDFTILRESRRTMFEEPGKKKDAARQGLLARFKRTA